MKIHHLAMPIAANSASIAVAERCLIICQPATSWPYLDDWPHPYEVYDFTIDRKREGPQRFLEGFRGYLQAAA
jgi:transposase